MAYDGYQVENLMKDENWCILNTDQIAMPDINSIHYVELEKCFKTTGQK